MYTPPYEERRSETWHETDEVCAEVVRVLTGPARGFDARVVDAYGTIKNTVPLGHHVAVSVPAKEMATANSTPAGCSVLESGAEVCDDHHYATHILPEKRTKRDKNDHTTDDADATSCTRRPSTPPPNPKKKKPTKPQVMYLRDTK